MILFDSSVVIDARDPHSPFHDWAKRQTAVQEGEGGAGNTIVVSEASVRSENRDAVPALLEGLGLKLRPLAGFSGDSSRKSICHLFGPIKEGGQEAGKPCPLPDFLIGVMPKPKA